MWSTFEWQVASLLELPELHVAHERRRAAAPEHHAGDAELPRHLQREAHERRRQHARHGRHAGHAAAEPRDELPQRRRAPVGGGLAQAEVVVLLVPVGVHQPVRDCLDPEPSAGSMILSAPERTRLYGLLG